MKIEATETYLSMADIRQKVSVFDSRKDVEPAGVLERPKDEVVNNASLEGGLKQNPEDGGLAEAVEKVNQYAELQKVNLRLSIDKDLQQVVVSIVDKETEELIRQIPSEQAVEMAKRLDEVVGELFGGLESSVLNTLSASV